jgi:hypothetical protein
MTQIIGPRSSSPPAGPTGDDHEHAGAARWRRLKRADAAMYAGKQAGKHTLRRGQASVGLVSA